MNAFPAPRVPDSPCEGMAGNRFLRVATSRKKFQSTVMMVGACVLIAAAVMQIVSTYRVFSTTADEPATVAGGMEWLDRGTYNLDNTHPPLARIAVALGPYLEGLRLPTDSDDWATVGNQIFHARGQYSRNIALARLGVLPFFILATAIVWIWSRKAFGEAGALIAVLLFSTLPPVLGNAGMATTDVVVTATFMAASLALMYWLECPTYARGALLGTAAALAVLSKFSALLLGPACGLAMVACYFAARRKAALPAQEGRRVLTLMLAGILAFLLVWGGYRFSFHITSKAARPHENIDRIVGTTGTLHTVAYFAAEHVPIPAPEFFKGVNFQRLHNEKGSASYLFGEARQGGWRYFFPLVLAIKSPLPFLILVAIGFFSLGMVGFRGADWRALAAAAMAVVLLLIAMTSRINLGVRLILPIYPLLGIVAALGAVTLWSLPKRRIIGRTLVAGLLLWQLASCLHTHPDYLAYFNPLAGNSPERIVVGPDLDWGQDLFRLSAAIRARQIDSFSVACLGSKNLSQNDLPPFVQLVPFQPTTGWIAVSVTRLMRGENAPPYYGYSWLRGCKPVDRVGRSILLYYVPPGGCRASPQQGTTP